MPSNTTDLTAHGAPTGLLCELLSHPETTLITNSKPTFGWVVNDVRRCAMQSAYQVIVSSGKAAATEKNADIWDSGKVKSADSINVRYGGAPLHAGSYWWAVRTWDSDDKPSPWSEPQQINIAEAAADQPFYSEDWLPLEDTSECVRPNRHRLETHSVPSKKVLAKAPGHYFVDFGRAAFGTLKLTITADADGQEVEIRLGEKPGPDSTVDEKPGGSLIYVKQTLPLKRGKHTYKLEFSRWPHGVKMPEHIGEVMPFRYCEIIGSPSTIDEKNVEQLAVFYRFDDAASSFASSDSALNDVWELCKYSIKATSFLGIYVDGQRERLPYEADAYINQLGHYAVDREYAMARYSHEHLIQHPTWPTEWILFSVLIAWEDYLYTGNADSIRRCYNDLVAKTLTSLAREDGLISTRSGLMTQQVLDSVHYHGKELRDVVDWPQGSETDGHVFTTINTVVNAFHYRALTLMGNIAEVAGRGLDAEVFRKRAQRVYSAFNGSLFDSKTGAYRDGEDTDHCSLHSNMFALAMGLVDDRKQPSVVKFIKSRGMACSVYGAQFLLEALYEADEDQAALELMTGETDRSWPHMIYDIGSTITLEAWDPKYKPNLDWNHAWGAAPASIIPRLLVGVEPLEPGFGVVRIKPRIGSLSDVNATVPTVRGPIGVCIRRDEAEYHLRCTIPANATAEVHLPTSDPSQVFEGDDPASTAQGVSYVGMRGGRAVYSVKSGSYDFSIKQPDA